MLGMIPLICCATAMVDLCTQHTTRVRSAITLWTTGKQKLSSHSSYAKSPQCFNAVRPNALHGDDSESFAVSLQEDITGVLFLVSYIPACGLRPSTLFKRACVQCPRLLSSDTREGMEAACAYPAGKEDVLITEPGQTVMASLQ